MACSKNILKTKYVKENIRDIRVFMEVKMMKNYIV
jgi:hypothetical protein